MKRLLLILPVMAAIMAPACSGSAGRADHASLEDEPVQGHSIDITSDTVGQWSMPAYRRGSYEEQDALEWCLLNKKGQQLLA